MSEMRNAYPENSNKIISKLWLLMLAMAFSNFMARGSYLLLAVGALFFVVHYFRIKIPVSSVPLLLFACIYFAFTFHSKGPVDAVQIFVCPLLWLVGYNLPEARQKDTIFVVMAVLSLGMAAHGWLNYAYNVVQKTDMYGSVKLDIWTGEGQAATGQAAHFSFFLACLYWMLFAQKKRRLRLLIAVGFFAALMYAVRLGSRTFLVLSAMVFAVGIGASMLQRGQKRRAVYLLLGLLTALIVFVIAYSRDLWGVRTFVEGSYFFRRTEREGGFFDLSTSERWKFKRIYLENLLTIPWGGGHLMKLAGGYAHDLWLDMFDEAGILALMAILWYTVAAGLRILAVRRRGGLTVQERNALLCYGIVIYAQFFAEPIWEGSPMLFYAFVLADGMFAKYLFILSESRYPAGRA